VSSRSNPGFTKEELGSEEIQITVRGRRSGKEISLPVWFVVVDRDKKIFLLPMHGSRSQWYKNLVESPTIQVSLGKTATKVQSKPVTNRDTVEQVADKFREKYGADQVKKYYTRFDACAEIQLRNSTR
jgi:deazaflavin-dependent oxidoreductase (nitroreductase family)